MEGAEMKKKKEDECYGASVEDRLLIQTHVYDEEELLQVHVRKIKLSGGFSYIINAWF